MICENSQLHQLSVFGFVFYNLVSAIFSFGDCFLFTLNQNHIHPRSLSSPNFRHTNSREKFFSPAVSAGCHELGKNGKLWYTKDSVT